MADERNDEQTEDATMDLLVAVPAESESVASEYIEGLSDVQQAGVYHQVSDAHRATRLSAAAAESEAIVKGFQHLTLHFNRLGFSGDDRIAVEDREMKAQVTDETLTEYIESPTKRRFYIDKAIGLCRNVDMREQVGSDENDWTLNGVEKAFEALKLTTRKAIENLVTGRQSTSPYDRLVDGVSKLSPSKDDEFMEDVRARRKVRAEVMGDLNGHAVVN